ncbi:hypothetical protein [Mesorhizobium sp. M8A.F.Ca.ET.021.01.1.1]|uniref:hypothetical protein n=1 Tax=Mesorhizobium sp. M8A.F.Ca.ET.021.01.1.1 TaxID=2496757 RepID=UPI000FCA564D|nr:hypothetical protein [Mesorhizobium sp. M8A.F.Ca.ET.021.01.1.1]RUW56825.1 hypothetical protein EOA36_02175 [Mesorhizobium sp. M8A.F.Ca.ET.021.01.1.1]
MQLPIDVSTAAIRAKYIEDETFLFNSWIVFGKRGDLVDVSDRDANDIFIGCTQAQAERIVEARSRFINEILEIING